MHSTDQIQPVDAIVAARKALEGVAEDAAWWPGVPPRVLRTLLEEAERYRWLRDKSEPGICAFYLSVGKAFHGVKFKRDTVDEAIDAARTAAMAEGAGT